MAEAGTLKLDFRALKCRNPIFFFSEYLLHIIEIPKQQNPVGRKDTLTINGNGKTPPFFKLFILLFCTTFETFTEPVLQEKLLQCFASFDSITFGLTLNRSSKNLTQ